jgi:hypothetical protein
MKLAKFGEWGLCLLLFAFLDASIVHPHDFWWHVKTGEIILSTGHIPDVELFAYTREGARWVNEPWLMQVLLAGVFKAGGLALVVFVHALFVTGGYALVWYGARLRSGLHGASLATLLGACVGAANWGVRPQGASFLFFGACVALIELDRVGRQRALWLAPPLFALWANCHGGFTFGLVALVTYLAVRIIEAGRKKEPIGRRVAVGAASMAACVLTPVGPRGIVEHVGAFFASSAAGVENAEFAPLTIHAADGLIFAYAIGRLAVAIARAKQRPRVDELVQLAAFGMMALWARRLSPWFGLVLIPILARALAKEEAAKAAPAPERVAPSSANGLRVFAVAGLFAFVVTLPWLRPRLPGSPPFTDVDTPIAAGRWVCDHVPEGERVYSGQVHASYLAWACPRVGQFVDTRVQAFPKDIWDQYIAVESGRFDWEEILVRWKIHWLMVEPTQRVMLGAVRASGHWEETFADSRAIVFRRTDH